MRTQNLLYSIVVNYSNILAQLNVIILYRSYELPLVIMFSTGWQCWFFFEIFKSECVYTENRQNINVCTHRNLIKYVKKYAKNKNKNVHTCTLKFVNILQNLIETSFIKRYYFQYVKKIVYTCIYSFYN